jgi:hypothetical protein
VAVKIIEISMRIVQFAIFDFRMVTPSHDLEKKNAKKKRAVFSFMAPPENMLKSWKLGTDGEENPTSWWRFIPRILVVG